jgi:hypothetical protein
MEKCQWDVFNDLQHEVFYEKWDDHLLSRCHYFALEKKCINRIITHTFL